MTAKELNQRLVAAFPELSQRYHEETVWQEGDDTGSHVVYGDVLVPVMVDLLKSDCLSSAQKHFDFLEELLAEGDEYAVDVVAVSVIESIFLDDVDKGKILPMLGKETLKIWDEFSRWETLTKRDGPCVWTVTRKEVKMSEDFDSMKGSFHYDSPWKFDIYHHRAFGYNRENNKMGLNVNPHGDAIYIHIEGFTITENGYSFLKGSQKRITRSRDKTPFEKSLTKELDKLINNFCFLDGYYTGLDGMWSLTEALYFSFSSWGKRSPNSGFLTLEKRGDKFGIHYNPDNEIIKVSSISSREGEIYITTKKAEIHYECSINPHLKDFVRFFLTEGFSQYIKYDKNANNPKANWTIYADE